MKLTEAMTPTGNPQSTCTPYMRTPGQLTTGTLCQPARAWRVATGRVMDDLFASQPIAGATLARSDIESLIGSAPRTLVDCDLEEADLSGLDLTRWRFERCNLRRSDLTGAKLEGTVWQGCRGPFANFSGANLSEAEFVGGDWNNCSMRRASLTSSRFTGS